MIHRVSTVSNTTTSPGSANGATMNSNPAKTAFKQIANIFVELSQRQPNRLAVIAPHARDRTGRVAYVHVTYAQLEAMSSRIANGLEQLGLRRGQRVVVMSRMQIEYYATIYALLKLGIVPAHIDSGMDSESVGKIFNEIEPDAFFADSKVFAQGTLNNWGARTVNHRVIIGDRLVRQGDGTPMSLTCIGTTIDEIAARGSATHRPPVGVAPNELAFLFTTSGSTGVAKAAVIPHSYLTAMAAQLRSGYGGQDAAGFYMSVYPIFPIFSLLMGLSIVIPPMDYTHPGDVDPKAILQTIEDWGVSNLFVTPAFMETMARHAAKEPFELSSVERVVWTGAPVLPPALARFRRLFPAKAQLNCLYGATEAVPTSFADTDELLKDDMRAAVDAGRGLCVGRVPPGVSVRIIKIIDGPIDHMSDDLLAGPNEIGEIIVTSPSVSPAYLGARATTLGKIRDPNTQFRFWHRLGDAGYFDSENRLWFCGRKDHRVDARDGRLFSVNCEAVFSVHPKVARTALVGVTRGNDQLPVMCIELNKPATAAELETIRTELLAIGRANPMTRSIETFLFHPSFPVDPRHNAKIVREALAVWAANELQGASLATRGAPAPVSSATT
jgi:acyl-CoA synthetase (AMP-forming)/AMP-acid ligase II